MELRNQELLRLNMSQLQQLAEVNGVETKYMAQIAEQTNRDSQTVRVATVIAMVYLPANAVLVSRRLNCHLVLYPWPPIDTYKLSFLSFIFKRDDSFLADF